jgi:hypothetical protein
LVARYVVTKIRPFTTMGVDCPESTGVRQRSFVGASNPSGKGPVLAWVTPTSDRKYVAVFRVSAKPRFVTMISAARSKNDLEIGSMVVVS